EAVKMANDTPTLTLPRSRGRVREGSPRIPTAATSAASGATRKPSNIILGINEGVIPSEIAPFGGMRLWFGGEIGFAGIEIDRHRDMLVDDEPPAPRLLVDVGHPHSEVELLALFVG